MPIYNKLVAVLANPGLVPRLPSFLAKRLGSLHGDETIGQHILLSGIYTDCIVVLYYKLPTCTIIANHFEMHIPRTSMGIALYAASS